MVYDAENFKKNAPQEGCREKRPVIPPFNIPDYPMNRPRRGKALILNHNKYLGDDEGKLDRKGSEKDVERLKEELTSLGFEIDIQTDKPFEDIQTKLEKVSEEDHSDADCLVVVVMSHGKQIHPIVPEKEDGDKNEIKTPCPCPSMEFEGQKYKYEQFSLQLIQAYDKPYDEKELFKFFDGDNCPTLRTKPKIFFIQACRGFDEKKTPQSKFEVSLSDRGNEKTESDPIICTLPSSTDFLIFRATVDGIYAARSTTAGTPFIQFLCEELEENKNKGDEALDLESLFVNVKRKVVEFEQGSQMPCVYSTLIRKLYLTPKNVRGEGNNTGN